MPPEGRHQESAGLAERLRLTAGRLSPQMLGPGPISVLPRRLDQVVTAALDVVPPDSLPQCRCLGDVADLAADLRREFDGQALAPAWLSAWLVADIVSLAQVFSDLTGTCRVRVRLETVDDDACRRFHTDNVRFRLVTTYRGPGTQWISPQALGRLDAGQPLPQSAIRQLDRGSVAIMRGSKGASGDRPGLLHRSPPIEGTGITRLFLAIDDAGDQHHHAAGPAR